MANLLHGAQQARHGQLVRAGHCSKHADTHQHTPHSPAHPTTQSIERDLFHRPPLAAQPGNRRTNAATAAATDRSTRQPTNQPTRIIRLFRPAGRRGRRHHTDEARKRSTEMLEICGGVGGHWGTGGGSLDVVERARLSSLCRVYISIQPLAEEEEGDLCRPDHPYTKWPTTPEMYENPRHTYTHTPTR